MSKIWRLFRFSGHARRGEYWLITILANIGLIMPVLVFGRQTSDVSGSVPNINVAINLESGAPEAALLVTLVSFALGLAVHPPTARPGKVSLVAPAVLCGSVCAGSGDAMGGAKTGQRNPLNHDAAYYSPICLGDC